MSPFATQNDKYALHKIKKNPKISEKKGKKKEQKIQKMKRGTKFREKEKKKFRKKKKIPKKTKAKKCRDPRQIHGQLWVTLKKKIRFSSLFLI